MRSPSPFLVLAIALATSAAHADRAADEAIALAMFNDGKTLAAAGDYASACNKYETADRLTGWLGVELNLADCYERLGRTASAWVVWGKAAAKADATHDDRAAYAHGRAAALESQLAHLTIVSTASTPSEIRVDDAVLGASDLGTALPIDPGEHVIVAGTWSRRVTLSPAASLTVEIETPVPPVRAAAVATPRRSRWLVWTLGGTSAALIGTSVWLGWSAKRDYDAAVASECDAKLVCSSQGNDAIHAARTRGDIATVLGGVGLATAAATVVLFVTRRDDHLSIAPVATPTSVGVSLGGTL
jgi:hypothetical protein